MVRLNKGKSSSEYPHKWILIYLIGYELFRSYDTELVLRVSLLIGFRNFGYRAGSGKDCVELELKNLGAGPDNLGVGKVGLPPLII